MHAGQNRRHHEIGIGIGTRHAMLDTAGIDRPDGNAQTGGAVVHAPLAIGGRKHIGLEAAIGIRVGRKQRHGFRHHRLQSADGMTQGIRAFARAVVEDVAAPFVEHADMDVQPAARTVGKGLGHEGGFEACGARGCLHDLLEKHDVIGRVTRIGLMAQIRFELAGRIFLAGGGERQVLRLRRLVERLKEIAIAIQIVEPIDRRLAFAHAGARAARRLRLAQLIAFDIEQIEFEFQGRDGRELQLGEMIEHAVRARRAVRR